MSSGCPVLSLSLFVILEAELTLVDHHQNPVICGCYVHITSREKARNRLHRDLSSRGKSSKIDRLYRFAALYEHPKLVPYDMYVSPSSSFDT